MDPHSGAAEQQRALEFPFGNFTPDAQPHSVEHVFGVVGIAVPGDAEVGDLPALFGQMFDDRFLQRESREIRADHQILVFYRLHNFSSDHFFSNPRELFARTYFGLFYCNP